MEYACPVCETPQADGRHLANHLAFTALIHGDDHEAWLDEHAPKWEKAGEDDLAERVIDEVAETELPRSVGTVDESKEAERTYTPDRDPGDDGDDGRDGHDRQGEGRTRSGSPPTNDRSRAPDSERIDPVGPGGDGDERDVETVLAEARELTERMRDGADGDGNGNDGDQEEGSDGEEANGVVAERGSEQDDDHDRAEAGGGDER
jgi:hypothetical protein